ncbi:MAG: glycosyltransferase [Burkholderiales bacterium]|nr:glycosyltransferase [Burkholderiales bacterium]
MLNEITPETIRIFIGYDSREPIAYHVCVQSILEVSSCPVNITPLKLSSLKQVFERERTPNQLTDFSYTRFLVPYLCQYKGWAIFIDGDMLIREDIANLWSLRDMAYTVMVVKHPKFTGTHTFLDNTINSFAKFNWASVILFNNSKCKKLTLEYLKSVEYQDLHQFKWIHDHLAIGELPTKWNHLVGYNAPDSSVSLVHWTLGGPYLGGKYKNIEYAAEWFRMKDKLLYAKID